VEFFFTFPLAINLITALTPQEDIIATSRNQKQVPNLIHKISKTTSAITEILSSEELRHIELML
jgi:hypothetical protein